jgi:hypothetical protein
VQPETLQIKVDSHSATRCAPFKHLKHSLFSFTHSALAVKSRALKVLHDFNECAAPQYAHFLKLLFLETDGDDGGEVRI